MTTGPGGVFQGQPASVWQILNNPLFNANTPMHDGFFNSRLTAVSGQTILQNDYLTYQTPLITQIFGGAAPQVPSDLRLYPLGASPGLQIPQEAPPFGPTTPLSPTPIVIVPQQQAGATGAGVNAADMEMLMSALGSQGLMA